jgi:hypothetical protein
VGGRDFIKKLLNLGLTRKLESEGGGNSMDFDENFGVLEVVAENFEIPLELAVQLFSFQRDDDFSLPAGLDVRIEPHHLHTSGVINFGNGKEWISGVGNLKSFLDLWGGPGQVTGIIIIGWDENGWTGQRINRCSRPREENKYTQPDYPYKKDLLHKKYI